VQVWHHFNPWYLQLFEIAGTKTKLAAGFLRREPD